LLERSLSLDALHGRLRDYQLAKRVEESVDWTLGGPTLILAFRPEKNGYVAVDVVDRPWPDGMGDPEKDSALFGAWSLSQFGPLTFPQNLERATQHSYGWPEAAEVVARHRAFLRVRLSYVFGAEPDALVMPPDYAASPEIDFLTRMASALLEDDRALCYFNPGGEVLANRPTFQEVAGYYRDKGLPPLDLWCNRRMFRVSQDWMVMDLVGLQQFDLPDLEVAFPWRAFDPNDMAPMLVNVGFYLISSGPVVKEGHTMDGPRGIKFRVKEFEESLMAPPRRTLRFCPDDGSTPPPELGFGPGKKSWQFWKR
ncbi:MAG: DUF4261 domain-containing protein, partial [Candidatus Eremiobacterota bacterium]